MNKEVIELVEAVRALRLTVVPDPSGGPERVRIGGPADDFPSRLVAVQRALEAFDKASAARADSMGIESAKLQAAIDGMFRWMRGRGIDIAEPYGILEEAMGVPMEKRKGAKLSLRLLTPTEKCVEKAKRKKQREHLKIRLLPPDDEGAFTAAPGLL